MKRIIDYLKLALFAFVVSASVISCSNDKFWRIDDIDSPLFLLIH